ncbi:MAG TPA: IS200/IS605 family transposase [Chryseosolibacter sp.]
MGQSLVNVYVHIVFSTKYREPIIYPEVESELHQYLGGVCNRLDCQSLNVGGYVEHIHILCKLSKKITLMKLVEEVKSHSSKWIKTKDARLKHFGWQDGYGAFSVDHHHVDVIRNYITNQHEHHSKKKFQKEYLEILDENGVNFDERYLWL